MPEGINQRLSGNVVRLPGRASWGLGWAWMWEEGGSRPHLYSKPAGYF